ncbi:hypothetical protein ACFSC3_15715 [Sphingomonas floccifaciens]|uniref:Uncharacterized protein n=1 Tax=Sphingomonas floccifaciens TaxID=1844115 RepID=A0ABW4NI51_9SPHN
MKTVAARTLIAATLCLAIATPAWSNAYREKGKAVKVADSNLTVTPTRDWNRLDIKPGKNAETWTLDGEQLNDVTFYGGIAPGEPLVRERSKRREPLPKFTSTTLLVEVPELLGGTYRAFKGISKFTVTNSKPDRFLDQPGVRFTYDYTDEDDLPRKGEAIAALVRGQLYMVTFDAPRLHYHDRTIGDFRALVQTAALTQ